MSGADSAKRAEQAKIAERSWERQYESGFLADSAAPYIHHLAFITAFNLLFMHVNVGTRCVCTFLCLGG
jgi:hypothetical protein